MHDKIRERYDALGMSIILLMFISLMFVACSAPEPDSEAANLEILNHQMTVQNFMTDSPSSVAVVSGTASNESSQMIEAASILVIFYNEDGEVIDTASAMTSNLQPGAVWNFSIQSSGTEAWKISRYDISAEVSR